MRDIQKRSVSNVLLIMAALCSQCLAQANSPSDTRSIPPTAKAFAGCYALELGRWWPWGMGEDTKFVTPPQSIVLQLEHGTVDFEQNGLVIRAIPSGPASRRSSYWVPQTGNGVVLIWTTGFSGVSLRLHKHGDELRGWAHAFFDFPRPPHVAHVKARRIACESAP